MSKVCKIKVIALGCLLSFLLTTVSFSAWAQEKGDWQGNAGLYSVMAFKPGLRLGAEYTFASITRPTLLSKLFNNNREVTDRWVVAPQLSVYWDPMSFVASTFAVEVGQVIRRKGPFAIQWRVGPGLYTAFLDEVYEVSGTEVKPLGGATRSYFSLSGTWGIGLIAKNEHSVWLNLHTQILLPYNATILPMVGSELVYQFPLDGLFR